jgi:hypothetical protein
MAGVIPAINAPTKSPPQTINIFVLELGIALCLGNALCFAIIFLFNYQLFVYEWVGVGDGVVDFSLSSW